MNISGQTSSSNPAPLGFVTYTSNSIGVIEFDAVFREEHSWDSTVTSNPVEGGSPTTDHIILSPDLLTISGIISDATLMDTGSNATSNRVQTAFRMLQKIRIARQMLMVYTKYKTYSDMVIKKITIPREPANGESIEFSMDFMNIRMTQTQLVAVPKGIGENKAASIANKATGKVNAGAQQTSDTNNSSILSSTFQNLSKSLGSLVGNPSP